MNSHRLRIRIVSLPLAVFCIAAFAQEEPDGTAGYYLNNSFEYEDKPVLLYVSHLTAVAGPEQNLVPPYKMYTAYTYDKDSQAGGSIYVAMPKDRRVIRFYGHKAAIKGSTWRPKVQTKTLFGVLRQIMEEKEATAAQGPSQPEAQPRQGNNAAFGGVLARCKKTNKGCNDSATKAPANPFARGFRQARQDAAQPAAGESEKELVPTGRWYVEFRDKRPPSGAF